MNFGSLKNCICVQFICLDAHARMSSRTASCEGYASLLWNETADSSPDEAGFGMTVLGWVKYLSASTGAEFRAKLLHEARRMAI
jgi:hypothetical protein